MTSDDDLGDPHLAARWGISLRTLQRWRAAGRGPAFIQLGRRRKTSRADIEAYERECRVDPAGKAKGVSQ